MSKFIFITGGVVSGIGKGIVAASVGKILKDRNFSVFVLKLDPYLNINSGLLSPYEHGEVYVTKDGRESDLDIGHYERFIDENFTNDSNLTSGEIFQKIISKERQGKYNGKTVQIIPHFTQEIKNYIIDLEKKYKTDFILVEIGGTIGDIENNPFVYAINDFENENQEKKSFFIHVTYVPLLKTTQDFKSKPTQQSISILGSNGIKPNLVILRSEKKIEQEIINKISLIASLKKEKVICVPDLKQPYETPLILEKNKVADTILNFFKFKAPFFPEKSINIWKKFIKNLNVKNQTKIKIAMVGKYIKFRDAYISIIEALRFAAAKNGVQIFLKWIDAQKIISQEIAKEILGDIDGVVLLPGFGKRGFLGKIKTAEFTRKNKIPSLGICLGFQAMIIAQASFKNIKKATSYEFKNENQKENFVINYNRDRKNKISKKLKLGQNQIFITKDSLVAQVYKKIKIKERFRNRFSPDPFFYQKLEDSEFIFSGKNKEGIAEICEVKNHPFYVGVQFHPEFNSRPIKSHPLFDVFIKKTKYKNKN